jgi:hypothetical protein
VRADGVYLWVTGDETATIERLVLDSASAPTRAGRQRSFRLADLVQLPGPPHGEAGVEGIARSGPWLWAIGSHALVRRRPKPEHDEARVVRGLSKIRRDPNRYIIVRLAVQPGVDRHPEPVRVARDGRRSALVGAPGAETLVDLLRTDPHLAPFLAIPATDNGFNVEGLAVIGERLYVGLCPAGQEPCCGQPSSQRPPLTTATSGGGREVTSDHPGLVVRRVRRGPDAWLLAVSGELSQRSAVSYLTEAEVDALLASCDPTTWTRRRDHVLLLLAVQTGLRISELTGLTRANVHLGLGAHVACHGKGRKDRITPLTSATIAAPRDWLGEHPGAPDAPLFPTRRGTPLSRDAIDGCGPRCRVRVRGDRGSRRSAGRPGRRCPAPRVRDRSARRRSRAAAAACRGRPRWCGRSLGAAGSADRFEVIELLR